MAKVSFRRKRQQWQLDLRSIGGGRPLMPKGTTKEEADKEFAKRVAEADTHVGPPVVPRDTTVDAYIDRWLSSRTELHPRTLRDYGYQLGHIRGAFGSLLVRALAERGRVRAFLAALRAPTATRPQGYSKDLVRLVRNVGSMLCEDAIEDGLLTRNPFQWRKSRRKQPGQITRAERTKKVRAMDGAQLDRFLAAANEHEPRAYPLFLTMARTGMRPGEALAVRWEDLDGAARTLHVCRALSLGEEGPTKTGTDRTIHLSTEAVAVLKRHRIDVERETLRRGWRE